MPELVLQVVSLDAAPPSQMFVRVFSDGGGTIGRDDTNSLALPDKHRRVSRLHATISFPGGIATITNSSTSLPISVGEQQVDSGESMPIANGALIEIGPYVLQAKIAPASAPMAPSSPAVNSPPAPVALDLLEAVSAPSAAVAHQIQPPASLPPANERIGLRVGAADSLAAFLQPPAVVAAPVPTPGLIDPMPAGAVHVDSLLVAPSPAFASLPAPSQQGSVGADPFANLLAGIGTPGHSRSSESKTSGLAANGLSADPLAALGGFPAQSGDPFSSQQGLPATPHRPLPGVAVGLIPDDFNPFEMPSESGRNSADPLANLLGTGAVASNNVPATGIQPAPPIDSLFQSAHGTSSQQSTLDMLSSNNGNDGGLANLLHSEGSSDPLALFDSSGMASPAQHRPMRDDSLEVGSSFLPPAPTREDALLFGPPTSSAAAAVPANPLFSPAAPPPAVAPAPQPASIVAVSASSDALTDAFLRGAGLSPAALPNGLTPEIMGIIGSLLRSATAGAVDMLAARAATKREVQASVTIISVQANNPLKFLPNADAALLQLLGKKMPGFMRADVAMRDAFDDLRAHEVGVIAGTRAALTEVLGKFDPAVLGDKLARGSVLESLMPSARKAKLWDMYLERYLQIRREAEDDFQSIFGRAFVQAYERETARIKGESPGTGGERA